MTNEERKEQVKTLFKNLSELPEEDKLQEFSSMVYAKYAVRQLIDCLKKNFSNPEELASAAKDSPVLNEIVSIAATYGTIGIEMGYASIAEDKDVHE